MIGPISDFKCLKVLNSNLEVDMKPITKNKKENRNGTWGSIGHSNRNQENKKFSSQSTRDRMLPFIYDFS